MQAVASAPETGPPGHEPASSAFQALIDATSSDVLWSGVVGGRAMSVSGSAQRVCGYSPAEMLAASGNIWIDRAHPADAAQIEEAYRLLVVTDESFDVEFRWQRADSAWIWLRGRAVVRGGPDASIVDAIFTDITTQKGLEDQVRRAQKLATVGEFTGGIAHDFNNLLAVILASATMLLDALPEGDSRRADADGIVDAANRAAELTKQLLAFTTAHTFEPRVLELNDVVRGAEKMLRRVLSEDVVLSMTLADGLGRVRADVGLIEQVLMNLVVNAADAMPDGGTLSIETSAAAGRRTQLTVSDTGCGMDGDTRRRVFEPFFTTKGRAGGTGLGLSTCLAVVKQAGGSMHVFSEPGRGSAFEVLLPGVSEDISAALPAPGPSPDCAGTEHILVVEDEAGVRSLVRRLLTRLGYHVTCARDGQEAFAILHSVERPFDLILCDVVMPDLAGPDVVARVQARSPQTRALFMSGHTTHSLVQDGTLREGYAFIRKPFTGSALGNKVREVLDA